jgi:hypothetical protein
MPDRQTTHAAEDDQIDAAILEVLLEPDMQRPLSADELGREIGDPDAATDGIARLVRTGLAHRLDGFVFASRAALRADALAERP